MTTRTGRRAKHPKPKAPEPRSLQEPKLEDEMAWMEARIDDLIQAKAQPVASHARYPEQRAPAAALKQPEAAGTGRQLQAVWRQLQQERVLRLQADKKYERAQAELQAIQAENSQFGGGKRTIMDQARTIERLEYELAAVLCERDEALAELSEAPDNLQVGAALGDLYCKLEEMSLMYEEERKRSTALEEKLMRCARRVEEEPGAFVEEVPIALVEDELSAVVEQKPSALAEEVPIALDEYLRVNEQQNGQRLEHELTLDLAEQIAPEGAEYEQIAPEYEQVAPGDAEYDQVTPEVAEYEYVTPEGAEYEQVTPEGAQYAKSPLGSALMQKLALEKEIEQLQLAFERHQKQQPLSTSF